MYTYVQKLRIVLTVLNLFASFGSADFYSY
jgi:hypothetical protein